MGARKILVVILLWSAVIPAFCQVASSKYQPATIMAVKPHQDAASTDSSTSRYDVSLKVGNTLYVVLFTPPPGAYGPPPGAYGPPPGDYPPPPPPDGPYPR